MTDHACNYVVDVSAPWCNLDPSLAGWYPILTYPILSYHTPTPYLFRVKVDSKSLTKSWRKHTELGKIFGPHLLAVCVCVCVQTKLKRKSHINGSSFLLSSPSANYCFITPWNVFYIPCSMYVCMFIHSVPVQFSWTHKRISSRCKKSNTKDNTK